LNELIDDAVGVAHLEEPLPHGSVWIGVVISTPSPSMRGLRDEAVICKLAPSELTAE